MALISTWVLGVVGFVGWILRFQSWDPHLCAVRKSITVVTVPSAGFGEACETVLGVLEPVYTERYMRLCTPGAFAIAAVGVVLEYYEHQYHSRSHLSRGQPPSTTATEEPVTVAAAADDDIRQRKGSH